ncbi:hypothetical protein K402DRAFT_402810 [Aulographum hederae CBS 113979]|uniref:Ribosomal RNA-processing protein 42 n=1 Tax=Aulographum hederae CBS 113979 TaxID=1176131 RepID=A0A6G1H5Y8_9PEZI|nr:hypothetical protein K402DRAFT_402810 [Aulographum hederae CBS 113979]
MAPISQLLLSPAELAYLHHSLTLSPPIRPDGRIPTQFRALVAESDILPGPYGSARVCFSDGTEAIVGIKAEVEKSKVKFGSEEQRLRLGEGEGDDDDDGEATQRGRGQGEDSWVDMSIEIPGFRDDDALPVFLSAMLTEALLSTDHLRDRLWINRRFHWKLYIDILLLSPPLSYPLPLLSLTTHLALLSARLPKLKSELDEDPLFDDDWEASTFLYPYSKTGLRVERPPITLLVMVAGANIIFDPSKEELAVAESVIAISAAATSGEEVAKVLAIRTIDPPSRLTPPGVPNIINTATGGNAPLSGADASIARETLQAQNVWTPPRGGLKRGMLSLILRTVTEKGGVVDEVLEALDAISVGT